MDKVEFQYLHYDFMCARGGGIQKVRHLFTVDCRIVLSKSTSLHCYVQLNFLFNYGVSAYTLLLYSCKFIEIKIK